MTGDVDRAVSDTVAVRLNGVYENSDSFRDSVNLERYGVSPTLTIMPSDRTRITFGYEHLRDARVADRGITSYQRPAGGCARSTRITAIPTTATSART